MATSDDPRRSTPWHGGDPDARAASDPSTSAGELARIARVRPDLHAALAANPSTYPDLVEWLALSPDPAVQAALRTRTATAGIPPAPGSPPDAPAPSHAPAPGVPKRRPRQLLSATLGVALVLALLGGGSAWWFLGRRSVPATSTDLLPVPSDDWANGADEAWTVSLDEDAVNGADSSRVHSPDIDYYSSAHYMAVFSGPESAPRSVLTTWDISDGTPRQLWRGSPSGVADSSGPGSTDGPASGTPLGILGSTLLVGASAIDLVTGETSAVPWQSNAAVGLYGDGMVVACSALASSTDCSGYDADLAETWSTEVVTGDSATSDWPFTSTVASDGVLKALVPSTPSGAAVLDLTTGAMSPFERPAVVLDIDPLDAVTALRDGWGACPWEDGRRICFLWGLDGRVLTPGGLPEPENIVANVYSSGGTNTVDDWRHVLEGDTPATGDALVVTGAWPGCNEVRVNGEGVPGGAPMWSLEDADDGSCHITDQPWMTVVSSNGGIAFITNQRESSAQILSTTDGVLWFSEFTNSIRLVRPDLLLVAEVVDGLPTVTAYRPVRSGSGGVPLRIQHGSSSSPGDATADGEGESGMADQEAASGADSAPTPDPTPESTPPVEGAYAGAGGPVPAGATEVTTIDTTLPDHPTAVVITPSGNIGCDISAGWTGCGVLSLIEDKTYGETEIGPRWVVSFGDGEPTLESSAARLTFMVTADPVQVLGYGDIVYFEHTVCASAQNGLTCWDTVTGHGAFLSRARVETF